MSSSEVGLGPRSLRDIVLSVTRGGRTLRFDDPLIGELQTGDVLVVVKQSQGRRARRPAHRRIRAPR